VRIGIDMLGVQSRESRGRGIGRYARSLVSTLIELDPASEYLLYTHPDLPTDDVPAGPNAAVRPLPGGSAAGAIDRLARTDPDALDVLLLLSPFELFADYDPPARPLDGPALVAVLYDLVPFLFQEKYLTWPPIASRFYRNLERLRGYDALLAISEATRADTLRLLGMDDHRVINIRGASDPAFFTPDRSAPMPAPARDVLRRLGIDRPFVFCLGSTDERKNLRGLIDAFRLVPGPLREAHQLVVACALPADDSAKLRRLADERGIGGSLVLTGEIPDTTLRLLYQRCAVFAFPSLYEGFGLPLLEAMHCGAAVIGGNNSSQIEVVGDAGLLVNAHDAADIAAALGRVLADGPFAERLRSRAPEQARRFSWRSTAGRALEALAQAARGRRPRRLRADRAHTPQPRIAVFSPWPPKGSGIADYSARLVRELRRTYAIDLYHDAGYVPDLGPESGDFGLFDHRLFDRNAAQLGYRGVLYQMGNSLYHRSVFEALRRHRGIVTLHDFALAGFHHYYARAEGADPDHFARELAHSHPDRVEEVLAALDDWSREEGDVPEACTRRGLHLNRRIFECAEAVVVHSPWCRDQVRERLREHLDRTVVIPHGASPRSVAPEARAAIRRRFDLPPEVLVVASFGSLHPNKMNAEAIAAFATLARAHASALLLLVGQDLTGGEARALVEQLGLRRRVRFLGRPTDADFLDLVSVTDIGISLRRPPTNGETSGALLHLLRHGVPTIVNDAGTFADYPDDVVCKVRWASEGNDGLARALLDLAADHSALGQSAFEFIARRHDWPIAAAAYVDLIERCHAERRPACRRPTEPPQGAAGTVVTAPQDRER
jgi:glycosyltransferase involved in cell wall biosynthesis